MIVPVSNQKHISMKNYNLPVRASKRSSEVVGISTVVQLAVGVVAVAHLAPTDFQAVGDAAAHRTDWKAHLLLVEVAGGALGEPKLGRVDG